MGGIYYIPAGGERPSAAAGRQKPNHNAPTPERTPPPPPRREIGGRQGISWIPPCIPRRPSCRPPRSGPWATSTHPTAATMGREAPPPPRPRRSPFPKLLPRRPDLPSTRPRPRSRPRRTRPRRTLPPPSCRPPRFGPWETSMPSTAAITGREAARPRRPPRSLFP